MAGNRVVNNSRKCIDCSITVPRRVKRCKSCNKKFLQTRGATYMRTPQHNALMSQRTKGIKRPNHRPASTNPEVADKIRSWWTEERRQAAKQRGLKLAEDPEWRNKIAISVSGSNNPRWKDGKSVVPYTPGFGRKVKQLAWERAKHLCEMCGSDNPVDTHHKDFQKNNHSLDNLQVLCRKCHKRLHAEYSNQQTTTR